MLMRKAAFAPFQACQDENGRRKYTKKTTVDDEDKSSKNQKTDKAVFNLDECGASKIVKKSDAIHDRKDGIAALTTPTTPSLTHVAADEKAHEIEQVFSRSDLKCSSDMARQTFSSNVEVGDFGVGFKFRKNLMDDSGTDLGWFEGEVVDILTDTGELLVITSMHSHARDISSYSCAVFVFLHHTALVQTRIENVFTLPTATSRI